MDAPLTTSAPTAPTRATPAPPPRRRSGNDVLIVLWHPGGLHLAAVRRGAIAASWPAREPVANLDAFASALDEGMAALAFAGTEVILALEHPAFRHQTETTPLLSEAAVHALLRAQVERSQPDGETRLWVAEPLAPTKTEGAHLLHLLPTPFYQSLNQLFLQRQLDLTRLLPITLPFTRLPRAAALPDRPSLVLAALDRTICIQVSDTQGRILVSRLLAADWESDAARIGVEVNRCCLFVKQRFGTSVGRVQLLARPSDATVAEITRKCPSDLVVVFNALSVQDWLQAILDVPPRHPVNLLAAYLARKRSQRLLRQGAIAAAWLGVAAFGLTVWSGAQRAADEANHFATLRRDEVGLQEQRERLLARNAELEEHERTIRSIVTERTPAVPPRFLSTLAATAPANVTVHECLVRQEASGWTFRVVAQVQGDDVTAQETLTTWASTLEKNNLRIRIPDTGRSLAPVVAVENPTAFRLSLEGGLLEP